MRIAPNILKLCYTACAYYPILTFLLTSQSHATIYAAIVSVVSLYKDHFVSISKVNYRYHIFVDLHLRVY